MKGKQEWNVTMLHTCKECSMGNISFTNCKDWQTVEYVDPAIFSKNGNTCLLKNGQFLKPGEHVDFSYAWDSAVYWVPSHADVLCS